MSWRRRQGPSLPDGWDEDTRQRMVSAQHSMDLATDDGMRQEQRRWSPTEALRRRLPISLRLTREEKRAITAGDIPWIAGGQLGPRTPSVERALTLIPVYSAASILSKSVASLPLKVYRGTVDGPRQMATLPQLFRKPSIRGNLWDWLHRCMSSLVLWGNAYGLITARDGYGNPVMIEWLRPDWVQIEDRAISGPGSYMDPVFRWVGVPIPWDMIVHIPWFTQPYRVAGLSPMGVMAKTLNVGLSAQDYTEDWYDGGGSATGKFKNSQKTVNQIEADQIKERLVTALRTHTPLVYGVDWDYEPIQIPPGEARFIETAKLTATQIASIYDLPPERVGGETGASATQTYQNIEQGSLRVLMDALIPYLTKLEATFFDLIPQPQYTKFVVDAMLRPDTKSRHEIYMLDRQAGIRNTNEIRELEDLEPLPDDQGESYAPLTVMVAQARAGATSPEVVAEEGGPATALPTTPTNGQPPPNGKQPPPNGKQPPPGGKQPPANSQPPAKGKQQRFNADQPRVPSGEPGGGQWGGGDGDGGSGATATLDRVAEPITAGEARGNSRAVSAEEFQQLAGEGRAQLQQMQSHSSPITGLDNRWDAVKQGTYNETRASWGGATIDAHTGEALSSDADRYALTVKETDQSVISVSEAASFAEFSRAMDAARTEFRPTLERANHYLGVFHDDDNARIDIDPVVVVSSPHEVEAIGAFTHAIGGAYHFATGDGYFPPHVSTSSRQDPKPDEPQRFASVARWHAFAMKAQKMPVKQVRGMTGARAILELEARRRDPFDPAYQRFDPDQPRVPSGEPGGGQWGGGDGGGAYTGSSLSSEQASLVGAYLAEHGVTPEATQAALEAAFKTAGSKEMAEKDWYRNANQTAQDMAQKTGVSVEQAAGVISALSPQTAWDRNVTNAQALLAAYSLDHQLSLEDAFAVTREPRAMVQQALDALHGSDPLDSLTGAKRRSFYDNIVNPNGSHAVTIDGHMVQMMTGLSHDTAGTLIAKPAGKGLGQLGGSYAWFADQVRAGAAGHGLLPSEYQAITWSTRNREWAWKKRSRRR